MASGDDDVSVITENPSPVLEGNDAPVDETPEDEKEKTEPEERLAPDDGPTLEQSPSIEQTLMDDILDIEEEMKKASLSSKRESAISIPTENELFEPQLPPMFKGKSSIFPTYSSIVDQKHIGIIGKMNEKRKRYSAVFRKDLEEQYIMSKNALAGVRMARCFVMGVHLPKHFTDPLTSKQRARVEFILKYNLV